MSDSARAPGRLQGCVEPKHAELLGELQRAWPAVPGSAAVDTFALAEQAAAEVERAVAGPARPEARSRAGGGRFQATPVNTVSTPV